MSIKSQEQTPRFAWRPEEWGEAIGVCRATVYNLMKAGKIKSVKNNTGKHGARLITTTHAEYLASLAEADGEL